MKARINRILDRATLQFLEWLEDPLKGFFVLVGIAGLVGGALGGVTGVILCKVVG
jgi:hypothetical protein